MTLNDLILIGVDIVAAVTLTLGIYYPRHRRRDLVVAFLGVNIGVLAVSSVLGTADIAAGLGLGLFGVLSIIRLRSSEISQREVAYYFAALAMGLIGGLGSTDLVIPIALIALILVALWAADHPALLARSRHQVVRLDRAVADEDELREALGLRLGGVVTAVTVQQLDLVNDSTLVDVRYRVAPEAVRAANRREAEQAATVKPRTEAVRDRPAALTAQAAAAIAPSVVTPPRAHASAPHAAPAAPPMPAPRPGESAEMPVSGGRR